MYLGEPRGLADFDKQERRHGCAECGPGLGRQLLSGLSGSISLILAALLPLRSGLVLSPRSTCARASLPLALGLNPVWMADHGFASLETSDLIMASPNYKISKDRATKCLSQIIGFNSTAGKKCCLNQGNHRRKLQWSILHIVRL